MLLTLNFALWHQALEFHVDLVIVSEINFQYKLRLGSKRWFFSLFRLVWVIFKASALWADAFYKSKCPYICLFVCLSVCSLLRYRLPVFLPPLPKVGCPIFFRDSESLGKSNGKKWSHIWTFLFGSGLKSLSKTKIVFFADFALQNMVETTLPDGLETSGRRAYR